MAINPEVGDFLLAPFGRAYFLGTVGGGAVKGIDAKSGYLSHFNHSYFKPICHTSSRDRLSL
jgi:hypothetical protein